MIISIARRQADLDTLLARLNAGGLLKFYSGSRPTDVTLVGNTLLGTCPFSSTAFGATNSSGVATANAITADGNPAATGAASFALAFTPGGIAILNFSVGVSAADIVVANTSVLAGTGSITVTSAVATWAAGN